MQKGRHQLLDAVTATLRKNAKTKRKKKRAYGTPDSHVVPHRSTDRACSGLTAQFGRDTVLFTEYGRRRSHTEIIVDMNHSSPTCERRSTRADKDRWRCWK